MKLPLFVLAVLVNAAVAPVVGLAAAGLLLYGRPLMVFEKDIAGVPLVFYAFIATIVPVVILTGFGTLIYRRLTRNRRDRSSWIWYSLGPSFGAIAGAVAGMTLVWNRGIALSGALAGAICGLVQAIIWSRGRRHGVDNAAA